MGAISDIGVALLNKLKSLTCPGGVAGAAAVGSGLLRSLSVQYDGNGVRIPVRGMVEDHDDIVVILRWSFTVTRTLRRVWESKRQSKRREVTAEMGLQYHYYHYEFYYGVVVPIISPWAVQMPLPSKGSISRDHSGNKHHDLSPYLPPSAVITQAPWSTR